MLLVLLRPDCVLPLIRICLHVFTHLCLPTCMHSLADTVYLHLFKLFIVCQAVMEVDQEKVRLEAEAEELAEAEMTPEVEARLVSGH